MTFSLFWKKNKVNPIISGEACTYFQCATCSHCSHYFIKLLVTILFLDNFPSLLNQDSLFWSVTCRHMNGEYPCRISQDNPRYYSTTQNCKQKLNVKLPIVKWGYVVCLHFRGSSSLSCFYLLSQDLLGLADSNLLGRMSNRHSTRKCIEKVSGASGREGNGSFIEILLSGRFLVCILMSRTE